jgi:hypothetical protein
MYTPEQSEKNEKITLVSDYRVTKPSFRGKKHFRRCRVTRMTASIFRSSFLPHDLFVTGAFYHRTGEFFTT